METSNSRSSKAQNLFGQLRNIVEEQEKTITQQQLQISSLQLEVESLTNDNAKLLEKIKTLENTKSESENNSKLHRRVSSIGKHVRTHSGHQIEGRKGSIERSASLQRKHLEEQDARHRQSDCYELSSDLKDKQLAVLRNHYGGADKCERAARVIQSAYREYQMKVKFEKIRKSKVRRLTIENVISSPDPKPTHSSDDEKDNESLVNGDVEVVELQLEQSFDQLKSEAQEDSSVVVRTEFSKPEIIVNGDGTSALNDCDNSDTVTMHHSNKTNLEANNDNTKDQNLLRSLAESPAISQHKHSSKKRRKHPGHESALPAEPLPATPENRELVEMIVKESRLPSNQCQSGNDDASGRRPSTGWQRTGSEVSLASFDNDPDQESLKSSDTGSINSDMLSHSGDATTNYMRRSMLSIKVSGAGVTESNDPERKRLYRVGLNFFNTKPGKGLNFLIEQEFVENTPQSVANFLYSRNGLSRQMVGEYLGNTQKEFNQKVLKCVCDLMDFTGLELDEALRIFQSEIRVQGEAQKVERLVETFSQRFCTCNTKFVGSLRSPDSIFILAFAIIMLNTDLHSPNMKHEKRMTEADFIRNLRGVDNGEDMSESLLKNVYNRIKTKELVTKEDHVSMLIKVENSIVGKKPVLAVPHRRLISRCRLFQVHDVNKAQKLGVHPREVFLFNDMILITKILQRKKQSTTYTFKQSITLHDLACFLFDSSYYPNGIRLSNTRDNKMIMTLNAPNEHDKIRFVNDVKECIAEVKLMEQCRIDAELERAHLQSPASGRSGKFLGIDSKRFSTSMQNLADTRLVNSDVPFNRRSPSSYSLTAVNENNNHIGGTKKYPVSPSPRNSKVGLSTFFTTPIRKSEPKRVHRTSTNLIPYSSPNGDEPGITLTLHKVHEV